MMTFISLQVYLCDGFKLIFHSKRFRYLIRYLNIISIQNLWPIDNINIYKYDRFSTENMLQNTLLPFFIEFIIGANILDRPHRKLEIYSNIPYLQFFLICQLTLYHEFYFL